MKIQLRVLFLFLSCLLFQCAVEEEAFQIIPCTDGSGSIRTPRPSFTRLHIERNQILNDVDSAVVLNGLVVIDPYFLFEMENYTKEAFEEMVTNWNLNIIRLPIHPDLYHNNPQYLNQYVDPIVEWAQEMEVYVLIGYHAHGNIATGDSELPKWRNNTPWQGNPYNADKTLAIKALEEIQTRYKNDFWVLLSIFNEPAFIRWSDWKAEAEEIIDRLRKIDPNSLLMISGVDFGYELEGARSQPIERKSIIYECHPYPWKGTNWVNTTCELSKTYPVFLGEWGYDGTNGSNANPENYALPLIEHTELNRIGWTSWIYHHEWEPTLISEDGTPNELGAIIKGYLTDF